MKLTAGLALLAAAVASVEGHGYLVKPSSRTRLGAEVRDNNNNNNNNKTSNPVDTYLL